MGVFQVFGRIASAALMASVLNGCVGTNTLVSKAAAESVQPDTKLVRIAGKEITLGRAAGYCFNDRQSRFTSTGAFVVMGPCDVEDEDSLAKGLVLVNVLAEGGVKDAIQAHTLEQYFRSEAGRKALSRRGKADSIEVLGTMQEKGIIYVHTKDTDGPVIPDTTADQWRLFFVVKDRLVSVAVINFTDDLMPDGVVFAQMEEIAKRIQRLNP